MNARPALRATLAAAWLGGWLLTSGCAARPQPASTTATAGPRPQPDPQAAAALRAVIQAYEAALNANDLEAILGLYGREPVFMPQHAPALVGRDAVRAGYQAVFATIKLDIRFELHDLTQAGDWAWARTSSAGRTRILAADLEVTEGNNELFVFRREDGAWRIHRYLFATNQPRP
jgi:uncharacterized protein (TIGR02246 family)